MSSYNNSSHRNKLPQLTGDYYRVETRIEDDSGFLRKLHGQHQQEPETNQPSFSREGSDSVFKQYLEYNYKPVIPRLKLNDDLKQKNLTELHQDGDGKSGKGNGTERDWVRKSVAEQEKSVNKKLLPSSFSVNAGISAYCQKIRTELRQLADQEKKNSAQLPSDSLARGRIDFSPFVSTQRQMLQDRRKNNEVIAAGSMEPDSYLQKYLSQKDRTKSVEKKAKKDAKSSRRSDAAKGPVIKLNTSRVQGEYMKVSKPPKLVVRKQRNVLQSGKDDGSGRCVSSSTSSEQTERSHGSPAAQTSRSSSFESRKHKAAPNECINRCESPVGTDYPRSGATKMLQANENQNLLTSRANQIDKVNKKTCRSHQQASTPFKERAGKLEASADMVKPEVKQAWPDNGSQSYQNAERRRSRAYSLSRRFSLNVASLVSGDNNPAPNENPGSCGSFSKTFTAGALTRADCGQPGNDEKRAIIDQINCPETFEAQRSSPHSCVTSGSTSQDQRNKATDAQKLRSEPAAFRELCGKAEHKRFNSQAECFTPDFSESDLMSPCWWTLSVGHSSRMTGDVRSPMTARSVIFSPPIRETPSSSLHPTNPCEANEPPTTNRSETNEQAKGRPRATLDATAIYGDAPQAANVAGLWKEADAECKETPDSENDDEPRRSAASPATNNDSDGRCSCVSSCQATKPLSAEDNGELTDHTRDDNETRSIKEAARNSEGLSISESDYASHKRASHSKARDRDIERNRPFPEEAGNNVKDPSEPVQNLEKHAGSISSNNLSEAYKVDKLTGRLNKEAEGRVTPLLDPCGSKKLPSKVYSATAAASAFCVTGDELEDKGNYQSLTGRTTSSQRVAVPERKTCEAARDSGSRKSHELQAPVRDSSDTTSASSNRSFIFQPNSSEASDKQSSSQAERPKSHCKKQTRKDLQTNSGDEQDGRNCQSKEKTSVAPAAAAMPDELQAQASVFRTKTATIRNTASPLLKTVFENSLETLHCNSTFSRKPRTPASGRNSSRKKSEEKVKETHATKEELNLGDRLHFQFGEDYHVKIVRKESNVGQKVHRERKEREQTFGKLGVLLPKSAKREKESWSRESTFVGARVRQRRNSLIKLLKGKQLYPSQAQNNRPPSRSPTAEGGTRSRRNSIVEFFSGKHGSGQTKEKPTTPAEPPSTESFRPRRNSIVEFLQQRRRACAERPDPTPQSKTSPGPKRVLPPIVSNKVGAAEQRAPDARDPSPHRPKSRSRRKPPETSKTPGKETKESDDSVDAIAVSTTRKELHDRFELTAPPAPPRTPPKMTVQEQQPATVPAPDFKHRLKLTAHKRVSPIAVKETYNILERTPLRQRIDELRALQNNKRKLRGAITVLNMTAGDLIGYGGEHSDDENIAKEKTYRKPIPGIMKLKKQAEIRLLQESDPSLGGGSCRFQEVRDFGTSARRRQLPPLGNPQHAAAVQTDRFRVQSPNDDDYAAMRPPTSLERIRSQTPLYPSIIKALSDGSGQQIVQWSDKMGNTFKVTAENGKYGAISCIKDRTAGTFKGPTPQRKPPHGEKDYIAPKPTIASENVDAKAKVIDSRRALAEKMWRSLSASSSRKHAIVAKPRRHKPGNRRKSTRRKNVGGSESMVVVVYADGDGKDVSFSC